MQEADLPSAQLDGTPCSSKPSWDIGVISHALQRTPELANDIAHGPGVRYDLADGAVTIELFPPHAERGSGIVRLSTTDSRQVFFRQPQPVVRDDGLIFQSHEHLLAITAAGQLTQRLTPQERHQRPVEASNSANGPLPPLEDHTGASGDAAVPQTVSQDAGSNPKTQPRVH